MFSFNAKTGEIFAYDVIGPADFGYISDTMVVDAIRAIGDKRVHFRLNTPGGNIDMGVSIFNALRRHRAGVTTYVDSLAASMGSYLMLAGDKRVIASNGMVMIHRAWSMAVGDADELRKAADVLEMYEDRVVGEYAMAGNYSEQDIRDIMAAETWYVGKEAVEAGWANELDGESDIEPNTTGLMGVVHHAPAALMDRIKPIDTKEVEVSPDRRTTVSMHIPGDGIKQVPSPYSSLPGVASLIEEVLASGQMSPEELGLTKTS